MDETIRSCVKSEFQKALDLILFSCLLQGCSLGNPCIRIEKDLVYLWDVNEWIPLSVEDVDSVMVIPYANLARFSLRDSKNYFYIPLRNSGITIKDLEDCFGNRVIVKKSGFFNGSMDTSKNQEAYNG